MSQSTVSEDEYGFSPSAISGQMDIILNSPEFNATDAQRAFLQYVVEKTLAGHANEIKGYAVATEVFGRSEDFDQSIDPVVSIQANKLRRSLERYYLVAGQNDPVRIDIPKGTYVPTFQRQCTFPSDAEQPENRVETGPLESAWPTVAVQLFQNLTVDPDLDYLAYGLATELAMEITRNHDLRVLMINTAMPGRRASDSDARFAIDGNVRKDGHGIKVVVNLNDMRTGIRIWGDMHHCELEGARLIRFQEHVAQVITAKIAGETGVISKALSIDSKKFTPSDLRTYQALLRYYEFHVQFTAETFWNAFEALEQAIAREPACGLAWSMLARLYAINHSMALFDRETSLEKAFVFAQKGVQLEPADQRVRFIFGLVQLFQGNIAAALCEAERALALNPNALILYDKIGYLMTLCGDWERGPALIRKAIRLNPYYSIIVHYGLWMDWIRQEDYEQAYLETLNFRTPTRYFDPLMKAAALGLLGKIDEGRQAVDDLLSLKPDFPRNGRRLLGHYIKFDEILDRTFVGLRAYGLEIAA
jgi:TolB-like protein